MDTHLHIPAAPDGSFTLGQFGAGLVWISLSLFLASAFLAIASGKNQRLASFSRWSFWGGSAALFGVFGILGSLFFRNQYQFDYVFSHSQKDYETWYKLSGVWAGQEGSVLLWSCLTAVFGLLTIDRFGDYSRWYRMVYGIALAAMVGISAYESPFRPLVIEGVRALPPDGRGMSPALLNYWMVIHPPTMFSGFALTTVGYALALSAMIQRDFNGWVAMARPWILACLGILGLGLCMGGFWAYETLGWGGFWAWDPVENTSFVPWCLTAAAAHGIIVQSARKKWQIANLVLASAPFILFCYGTFLTRSGFLGDTSVHSFARMDPQAMGILVALMGGSTFGFLACAIPAIKWWSKHKPEEPMKDPKPSLNRAALYGIGVWLIFGLGLVTAIGMSIPLIQSLSGQKPKVVSEDLYSSVLAWFFFPSLILIGIAPFVSWRGSTWKEVLGKVVNPLALAVMFTGFLLLWSKWGWNGVAADPELTTLILGVTMAKSTWVSIATFFCLFAVFTNAFRLWEMIPRARKTAGGVLTHVGAVLTMIGLIVSHGMEQKKATVVHPSKPAEAFGMKIAYKGPTSSFDDRNNKIQLEVSGLGKTFMAHPGLYFKQAAEGPQETMWPSIERRFLYDIYLVLSPMNWGASETLGLEKGQSARYENLIVTYKGLRSEGKLGTRSAMFFADTEVVELGQPKTFEMLGGNKPKLGVLDENHALRLVKVNPELGSATLILSSSPDKPMSLVPKAAIERDGWRITFNQFVLVDEAVGAQITAEPIVRKSKASPAMGMAGEQKARLNKDFELVLERIDAGTKNAFLRFDYVQPAYPIEVYYKPLTWAVWLGVGIMTAGSLWSAYGRRTPRSRRRKGGGAEDSEPRQADSE